MPPTDDIMGHSDHFLSGFYDLCYPDCNFISQNNLGSPVDIPCDLAGYHPFPRTKESKPHYYDNNSFYAQTYPLTTTSVHDKQTKRPLSNTNNVWSTHSFDGVLDAPVAPTNVTLTPSNELSPIVSDAPFIPGHGAYPDRKGNLLSPLNGFRLQNLPPSHPPPSTMLQGCKERFRDSSSSCFSPDILSPPDSPASPPYLSYEHWMSSPASVTTDTDDDSSLASSISSLSPDPFDQDLAEIPDEDDNFYSTSPRRESIYQPLDQYPLRTSPHSGHDERFIPEHHLDDNNLSPLTFSPPSLTSLHILSPLESEPQPVSALNIKKSSTYNPPSPLYEYNSFFDYDPSTPVPCSPSLRRPSTLPELEPTTFDADPFGLHQPSPAEAPTSPSLPPLQDIDIDIPDLHWRSLPGGEIDDDLIPMDLASKNYIPDPSAIVPTTSTGVRSLLLWDHDLNPDRSDIPTPRSPSPENFYLDPTVLAECDDEELHQVYELRQRTAKSEKWERERCRELSALLRLKLDERGVLGGGSDCGNHKSGSRSGCSNLSFASPSSDSLTVYQPQPRIPSSSSPSSSSPLSSSSQTSLVTPSSSSPGSALPSTSGKPQAQSEAPKHKIRSMAQLVASMIFHRQRDALNRHLTKKARLTPTSSQPSHHYSHLSTTGGAGTKVLPTPRSRLSKVFLPEELELGSEDKGQGTIDQEAESGDEAEDGDGELIIDMAGQPMSHNGMDADLDESGSSSHNVTIPAPLCTQPSTQ